MSHRQTIPVAVEVLKIEDLAQIVAAVPVSYHEALADLLSKVASANQRAISESTGTAPEATLNQAETSLAIRQVAGTIPADDDEAVSTLMRLAKSTLGRDGKSLLDDESKVALARLVTADLDFILDGDYEPHAPEKTRELLLEDPAPWTTETIVLNANNTGDCIWFTTDVDKEHRTFDLYDIKVAVRRPRLADIFPAVEASATQAS